MPRRITGGTAGLVFHVLNRSVRRAQLFHHDGDYHALIAIMAETLERIPVRLFAFCIMPNHFHLVCSPTSDGQLSDFMRLTTLTHAKRWHAAHGSSGTGHVYQGRFRAFPVQSNHHFLTVCRYVERNALRASLVRRAEVWPWSSLNHRCRNCDSLALAEWPILQPPTWLDIVNSNEPSLKAIRNAVARSRPYGDDPWVETVAKALGLEGSLATIGRPAAFAKVGRPAA